VAIGIGVPIQIAMRGTNINQQVQMGQWFVTDGAAFLTADATAVGEAFWDQVKTTFRATQPDTGATFLTNILVSEPGPTGAFGEYAVPPEEQMGTRDIADVDQALPPFIAAGIRLTVATRLTRPGQKRLWGQRESDQFNGTWTEDYQTLVNAFAAVISEPITLGAPVATGVLIPVVTRLSPDSSEVLEYQNVTGFVLNPNVTSQNSRKFGRGI